MGMSYRLFGVKQKVPAEEIKDVRKVTLTALEKIGVKEMDFKELTVGITAGSRGINAIGKILGTIASAIRQAGGIPVLIPSMGTHGGSTADRQIDVLASLGITEEALGIPIQSCVESVLLGETPNGTPVYCSLEATKVDRIVVVNRIKPHTDFSGNIESGICKMMAIGLGNHQGALTTHSHAIIKGYEKVITDVASFMLQRLPVAFAVGILENWKSKTTGIEAILPEAILEKEKILLKQVKSSLIKLPFECIDVLILREIGKNISGTCMDTKVVGRIMIKGQREPKTPKISRIVVLGLTPESHGNAIGIGLADIITQRVFEAIDLAVTADNSISSMTPEQGRLPCIAKNDREAIQSAVLTLGAVDPKQIRLVYIQNTLQLEVIAVSEVFLEEVKANSQLQIIGSPEELRFDGNGCLLNFQNGLH